MRQRVADVVEQGTEHVLLVAAVAVATALEGGVDLLPPEDRLRPYRAEGLDDRITLSSTSPNCPLPPTVLRGAPRFGLQGASVDIYGYRGGARDASSRGREREQLYYTLNLFTQTASMA